MLLFLLALTAISQACTSIEKKRCTTIMLNCKAACDCDYPKCATTNLCFDCINATDSDCPDCLFSEDTNPLTNGRHSKLTCPRGTSKLSCPKGFMAHCKCSMYGMASCSCISNSERTTYISTRVNCITKSAKITCPKYHPVTYKCADSGFLDASCGKFV